VSSGPWRQPAPIGEALGAALRRLGLDGRMQEQGLWRGWAAAVGPGIARHAQPQSLRQGRLVVHVTDPVWLHQLSMMRPRLIEALNLQLGAAAVRELALRVGEVAELPAQDPPPPSPDALAAPDAARVEEVEALLAPLTDPETREAFRRLLLRAAPPRQQ